jgi:hypothetical protein
VSPSNLAQLYLQAHDGEDLATTLARSRQAIRDSHDRIRLMVNTRIMSDRAECREAHLSVDAALAARSGGQSRV